MIPRGRCRPHRYQICGECGKSLPHRRGCLKMPIREFRGRRTDTFRKADSKQSLPLAYRFTDNPEGIPRSARKVVYGKFPSPGGPQVGRFPAARDDCSPGCTIRNPPISRSGQSVLHVSCVGRQSHDLLMLEHHLSRFLTGPTRSTLTYKMRITAHGLPNRPNLISERVDSK